MKNVYDESHMFGYSFHLNKDNLSLIKWLNMKKRKIRKKEEIGYSLIFIVDIISQLRLEYHEKPDSTERLFHPIMGLLINMHS